MTGSEKQKWSMVTLEPTTDGVGEGGGGGIPTLMA